MDYTSRGPTAGRKDAARAMRILLHCDEYSPHWGPCTVRCKVFSDTFRQAGDHVTVLASSTNLADGAQGDDNAIYCPTPAMKKKTALSRLGNNLGFALSSWIRSRKAGPADVVITTSPPVLASLAGWAIARSKRARLVYDVRDVWPDVAVEIGSFAQGSLYYRVFKAITDFMLRHADAVTTVSPGKLKKLREKLPPRDWDKLWLVENGLDESFLQQPEDPEAVEKYGLEQRRTCVYIGNIGLAQGLEHFIRLAETADPEEYQFLLFGDGAERRRLEQLAADKGLEHVRFAGAVDSRTVLTVLRHAAMTYIPLVNANLKDSIPTKTYEAMGAGCPILMAAEGDAPALLAETGFGRSLSPNEIQRLPEVFRQFWEEYDSILARREDAMRIALEIHSRQRIALRLEEDLRALAARGK